MGLFTPDLISKALNSRVKRTVSDSSLRPAAVLLCLYPKDGDYCILLNKRSEQVEHHKGEISFPGGARDPEDRDFLDTALRESEEEMGIRRSDVTILGELDDIITRSNFEVKVFVATIPYPYPFKPSDIEIAEVLEVPLSVLRDPSYVRQETHWADGHPVTAKSYAYNQHIIFGATAKILEQFLELLEDGLAKEAG
jgi:8-oxo-dGTP pyrophosphatase MutT (NUDIX family)